MLSSVAAGACGDALTGTGSHGCLHASVFELKLFLEISVSRAANVSVLPLPGGSSHMVLF